MPEIFDPYYTWLGIPPKDQPPHLYRLLGVDLFESNPDVIANAADQRMAHLRSFQTGNHAALSQKLLNELAAARICLLNPSKKVMYDHQLQQRLAVLPSAPTTDESFLDSVSAYEPPKVTRIKSHKTNPVWFVLSLGVVSLVVVGGLLLLRQDDKKIIVSNPSPVRSVIAKASVPTEKPISPKLVARPETPRREPVTRPPKAEPTPQPVRPKLTLLEEPSPLPEIETPKVEHKNASQEPTESATARGPATAVQAVNTIVLWNQHIAGYNDRGTKGCNVALLRSGKEVWQVKNVEIPWAANQDTFLSLAVPRISADTIRVEVVRWHGKGGGLSEVEVFCGKENIARGCRVNASAEYSGDFAANTLTDRITTSAEDKKGYWLLPDGTQGWAEIHLRETQQSNSIAKRLPIPDDAAQEKALAVVRGIYKDDYKDKTGLATKLIERAKETQAPVERFVLLQEARAVASEVFQGELAFQAIDILASIHEVSAADMKAEIIEKSVRRVHSPEQRVALAQAALNVMDEAIVEGSLVVAKQMGRQAGQLARMSKNKELLQEIATKNKEVELAARACADAKKARATLRQNPDDPSANLMLGKYLCLSRGCWEAGLPMLALSDSADLKALATQDMKGATTPEKRVHLGDMWWDSVGKQRATIWYRKALPDLSGMEKDRVEKRVAAVLTSSKQWQPEFAFHNVKWIDDYVRLEGDGRIVTAVPWQGYFDVTIVARTNSTNIRMYHGQPGSEAGVIWNWELDSRQLRVHRLDGSIGAAPTTPLQASVWYKLRWIVASNGTTVMLNGRVIFSERRTNGLPQSKILGVYPSGSIVDVKFVKIVSP